MWKNLSHPNVLNLIGVPDTLEDARFSMVSEWMANDDIVKYVRANAGNHLKLVSHYLVIPYYRLPIPHSSRAPLKDWRTFTTPALYMAI